MFNKTAEASEISVEESRMASRLGRGVSRRDDDNESVSAKANETYYLSNRYRWLMAGFAAVVIMFSGPVFMNWPKVEEFILKGDAYRELCLPEEKSCKAQELAVSALAGFSISMMFSFTFVAGVILDTLGAKICTMLGISSIIMGYVFLALSSATRNFYKVFIFFISAGADPALFGLLSISNLFPSHSSTVIAVFGTTRGISFAIPIVMCAVWNGQTVTVRGIAIFFGCVLVAWLVMIAYFLPFVPFPTLPPGAVSSDEERTPLLTRLKKRPTFSWKGFMTGTKIQIKEFAQYGFSWAYLALLPLPVFVLVRNSYYSMTFKRHLPNTIGLLNRLSASLAIFILSLSGAVSMCLVMFKGIVWEVVSNIFNWLFMSFIASQFYVYVTCKFVQYQSKRRYLAAVYPQSQMGKLVGIALLFGGTVSNVAKQMFEKAETSNMYPLMDSIVVAMGVAGCVISACLWFFVEKPEQRSRRAILAVLKDMDENPDSPAKHVV